MIRSRKLGFAASFLASLLSFLPISNAELPKPLPNQIVAEYKSSGLDDKGKPIGGLEEKVLITTARIDKKDREAKQVLYLEVKALDGRLNGIQVDLLVPDYFKLISIEPSQDLDIPASSKSSKARENLAKNLSEFLQGLSPDAKIQVLENSRLEYGDKTKRMLANQGKQLIPIAFIPETGYAQQREEYQFRILYQIIQRDSPVRVESPTGVAEGKYPPTNTRLEALALIHSSLVRIGSPVGDISTIAPFQDFKAAKKEEIPYQDLARAIWEDETPNFAKRKMSKEDRERVILKLEALFRERLKVLSADIDGDKEKEYITYANFAWTPNLTEVPGGIPYDANEIFTKLRFFKRTPAGIAIIGQTDNKYPGVPVRYDLGVDAESIVELRDFNNDGVLDLVVSRTMSNRPGNEGRDNQKVYFRYDKKTKGLIISEN